MMVRFSLIARHSRSTRPFRAVAGLLLLGSLSLAGPALAQYGPFGPFERDYRDPHGWWGPPPAYHARPPIIVQRPIPPRVMASFLRDEGLVAIERLERLDDVYVAHGRDRQGRRLRIVADAFDGQILDRMRLSEPPRERVRPLPPRERPAPPAVRSAPERTTPQRPAPAPRPPQPPPRPPEAKPVPSAPAPVAPSPNPPASPPAAPAPAPANPAGAPAPAAPNAAPANPAGSGGIPAIRVPDVPPPVIPVQPLDDTPSRPRPVTPAVPTAPLL
jgi:hypothetical protein